MSKLYRFIILLIVLGVCFLFLLPTIRWYSLGSDDRLDAQLSREKIRENAQQKAEKDYDRFVAAYSENKDGPVPEELEFLIPISQKMYKDWNKGKKTDKKSIPKDWTVGAIGDIFPVDDINAPVPVSTVLLEAIEQYHSGRYFKLKELQNNAVKLGLDLSGGLSIILRVTGSASANDNQQDAMNRALEVLNSRIDQFGLTEPVIRTQGSDQIYIEIPGTADPERINDIIMGKGSLTFQIMDTEATNSFYDEFYRSNHRNITIDQDGGIFFNGERIDYSEIPGFPSDVKVLGVYSKDRYGLDVQERDSDNIPRYVVIKNEIGLDGNRITDAYVDRDNMDGRPVVIFTLDSDGAKIFGELTSLNKGKPLAIILDNKVKSHPNINEPITGGRGSISGFSAEEAANLALVLRTGALPVTLEVDNRQSIGASLGNDTIRQGLYALLGGIAAVFVFLLFYYRTAGINAIIAQLLNFYIMFSVLSALNFTLTLPAIAGFILTIGMATDANVIIFERMKEEMRLGKTRKAVVEAGFGKAFWAIMDSNITTFIAALFLSQLGSGPIRGFAVSLSIGVFSSVFTALFVSRLIFDFGTDVFRSKKLSVSWTTRIQDGSSAARSAGQRQKAVSL